VWWPAGYGAVVAVKEADGAWQGSVRVRRLAFDGAELASPRGADRRWILPSWRGSGVR
jgi:hypothetical protein